jgi:hypothetical protein
LSAYFAHSRAFCFGPVDGNPKLLTPDIQVFRKFVQICSLPRFAWECIQKRFALELLLSKILLVGSLQ